MEASKGGCADRKFLSLRARTTTAAGAALAPPPLAAELPAAAEERTHSRIQAVASDLALIMLSCYMVVVVVVVVAVAGPCVGWGWFGHLDRKSSSFVVFNLLGVKRYPCVPARYQYRTHTRSPVEQAQLRAAHPTRESKEGRREHLKQSKTKKSDEILKRICSGRPRHVRQREGDHSSGVGRLQERPRKVRTARSNFVFALRLRNIPRIVLISFESSFPVVLGELLAHHGIRLHTAVDRLILASRVHSKQDMGVTCDAPPCVMVMSRHRAASLETARDTYCCIARYEVTKVFAAFLISQLAFAALKVEG